MTVREQRLDQQIIVIIGATPGIGRATARGTAGQDAVVALVARTGDALDQAAQGIAAAGGRATTVIAEVRSRPPGGCGGHRPDGPGRHRRLQAALY